MYHVCPSSDIIVGHGIAVTNEIEQKYTYQTNSRCTYTHNIYKHKQIKKRIRSHNYADISLAAASVRLATNAVLHSQTIDKKHGKERKRWFANGC